MLNGYTGKYIENLKKQERNPLYHAWVKSRAKKFVMMGIVRDEWKKILDLYKLPKDVILLSNS